MTNDYAIRHATCETKLLSRTSKHVAYLYASSQATSQDIKQLTKAKHFIFTDDELAYQQIKCKDTESKHSTVSLYMGLSEVLYETDNKIPQNVIALVMAHDEKNEKIQSKIKY